MFHAGGDSRCFTISLYKLYQMYILQPLLDQRNHSYVEGESFNCVQCATNPPVWKTAYPFIVTGKSGCLTIVNIDISWSLTDVDST